MKWDLTSGSIVSNNQQTNRQTDNVDDSWARVQARWGAGEAYGSAGAAGVG